MLGFNDVWAFLQAGAERYKYTTIDKLFEPNYGLNINRLEVPVDPYKAFRCDVPNLSTSLYFIVNDQFRQSLQPKENLPEGIEVASLAEYAKAHPEFVAKHYARLAKSDEDAVTALNTMLAQDGLLVHVKRNVVVDKTVQVINILRSDVPMMLMPSTTPTLGLKVFCAKSRPPSTLIMTSKGSDVSELK